MGGEPQSTGFKGFQKHNRTPNFALVGILRVVCEHLFVLLEKNQPRYIHCYVTGTIGTFPALGEKER